MVIGKEIKDVIRVAAFLSLIIAGGLIGVAALGLALRIADYTFPGGIIR